MPQGRAVTFALIQLLNSGGKPEDERQMMDFLCEIRDHYPATWRFFTSAPALRHPFRAIMVLPTGVTFPIIRAGYRVTRQLFGFN